ncbi:MAG: SBBP repeat-containing protein [Verrucomicrobia subdivision 3 bacterium]|nr:SBBP repeat-containing protein [Limisphaerales bacterium]
MVIAGLVTLLFFSLGFSAHAQNGTLAWAKRAGSNGIDDGNGVAVDTNGNVYVTGYFKSTATFGTGETNQTMLTALGQDLFVAKYAPSGGLLWVRQARSQAGWGTSIGVDDAGNSYVFGYFGPTITFATGEPGQVALSAAANDLFLAKYDTDGNFLWAKQAGGSFSEYGYGIAVDGSGDSYVTGRYGSNPVTFGAGESNETALAGIGGNNGLDVFVAKYDANGLLQWAKSAGGSTGNWGAGIDIDTAGNSYVVGRYSTTSTFGPGEPNQTVLVGPLGGSDEIFVAKFGPNGNLAWVRGGQGQAEHDQGTAIAVDAAGNSYATGTYRGIAPFGGQLNQTQIDYGGMGDIYIVKHDTDGNQQWVKMAVGSDDEFSLGIALDSDGSPYLTGYGFVLTFGAGEVNEVTLAGIGQNDIFLAKYGTDGLLQWARFDGGTGDDHGHALAIDAAGGIHVAGRFGQTATFGSGETNQTVITSAGGSDIFIAKFQSSVITTQPATFVGFVLLPNGNPELTISGTALKSYIIRRSGTIADPIWNNVGNIIIDAQGHGVFEDTDQALVFPAFYQAVGN